MCCMFVAQRLHNGIERNDHGPDQCRKATPLPGPTQGRAAVATLPELQEYCSERLENAPVPLRDSPHGLKLQAIDELDFSDLEAIEVPLGYGND